MLKLTNLVKDYHMGEEVVHALKGINLSFRKKEFVAILGPSGCGKTTFLNIIGGLDRYTSGDLSIGGISTTRFKDRDWDSYRNHTIGFVFQSYNLIPHQSVLSNVELALTLSGISKAERRKRAMEALSKVGLSDQCKKRPSQMSGGQMQRVAIARAIVNDPDILLADEPTGALDSATSVQIMEILKEIAKDKLVIMVTHNGELAEDYANRIVRFKDGEILSDTNPYNSEEEQSEAAVPEKEGQEKHPYKKTTMSFFTALSLSLNNLMTKKGRTFLTAFAGSIGIIGIALILSLSDGFKQYINRVQEETLASYPISLNHESMDYTSLMSAMTDRHKDMVADREDGRVYALNDMSTSTEALLSEVKINDLSAFKEYLENEDTVIKEKASLIRYVYRTKVNIYREGETTRLNPSTIISQLGLSGVMSMYESAGMGDMYDGWFELPDNPTLIKEQYSLVAGSFPEKEDEALLVVNSNNTVMDIVMYAMGLKDVNEIGKMMEMMKKGESNAEELSLSDLSFSYEDIFALRFKVLPETAYYEKNGSTFIDSREDEEFLLKAIGEGHDLHITGIVKEKEGIVAGCLRSGLYYMPSLKQTLMKDVEDSEVVKAQKADPKTDVLTGLPFKPVEGEEEEKKDSASEPETEPQSVPGTEKEGEKPEDPGTGTGNPSGMGGMFTGGMTEEQIAMILSMDDEALAAMLHMSKEQAAAFKILIAPPKTETPGKVRYSSSTYEKNLKLLDTADSEEPDSIEIYAKTFEDKDAIAEAIKAYNDVHADDGKSIQYTDYIALFISSVSSIIDAISYVLIAFVGISLVVSSIMIGIITYISVLERTKEIGILRAMGASKKDVARVFNAETVIIGFCAGLLGVIVTVILNIPINMIIKHLAEISNVAALPPVGAVVLVAISVVLTLIGGLIPAGLAARKDPVEALRSE